MSVAAERIDVVYPDGRSHNVEATILDPVTGDYFIITKERRSTIFRIPAASLVPGTTVVPANVGEMMLDDPNSTHDRPVAADISTDGSMIVVKNMELTYYWHRAAGQSVGAAPVVDQPLPVRAARFRRGDRLQRQQRSPGHPGRGPRPATQAVHPPLSQRARGRAQPGAASARLVRWATTTTPSSSGRGTTG